MTVTYKAKLITLGLWQIKGIQYDKVFSPVVDFFNWAVCQF